MHEPNRLKLHEDSHVSQRGNSDKTDLSSASEMATTSEFQSNNASNTSTSPLSSKFVLSQSKKPSGTFNQQLKSHAINQHESDEKDDTDNNKRDDNGKDDILELKVQLREMRMELERREITWLS